MKRYDTTGIEVRLGKLCSMEPEWAANRIEALEAEVAELKAYQEKLLCENEIHGQCIANIIDTKPGGSIEGQMIAATQACVRAEQRNEELEAKLDALKKDALEIGEILSEEGCFCDCGCDAEGHSETCERCLGCRIDVILQRILKTPEPK